MDHDQQVRYARNITMPEIGEQGQEKLLHSRALVIGAGGLGSPLLYYLAATGVGTITVVDPDRVALSNLQRQTIHETGDVGRSKVESAVDTLHDLNPDITIIPEFCHLDGTTSDRLIPAHDIVADGCDDIATRFLLNQACLKHEKTLVSAAVVGMVGQLYTFKPYLGDLHPCYQCLYAEMPPEDAIPTCAEAGILGSVAGILGSWQATEIIKELLGIGESLSGSMILLDALTASIRKVSILRDPKCTVCGG